MKFEGEAALEHGRAGIGAGPRAARAARHHGNGAMEGA
jgi:hypothetical protein